MLCLSQEQHDEYLDDLRGDGFDNSFQRAFHLSRVSARLCPLGRAKEQAAPYLRNGLCAVVTYGTVYCPSTDAAIGLDHRLAFVGSREACEAFAAPLDADGDAESGALVLG